MTTHLRTRKHVSGNMIIEDVQAKHNLDLILKNNKQVLGLFCSSWCPFCRDFLPCFKDGIKNYRFEKVVRVFLEDDDNPLWENYAIEAVPTVIFFENSRISRRLDARLGEGLNEKQFREWLLKIRSLKPS